MMSQKRPKMGPGSDASDSATDGSPASLERVIHGEKLNGLSGFSDRPSENHGEFRSVGGMKLHQVLRSLMNQNNESARSAAKACSIPLSTFNGYLKPNKKQVDPGHLMAMAKHYGVTIDYLFGIQRDAKFDKLPTRQIFSRWVKVTIEDIADEGHGNDET